MGYERLLAPLRYARLRRGIEVHSEASRSTDAHDVRWDWACLI
jgi:hypothetical protein